MNIPSEKSKDYGLAISSRSTTDVRDPYIWLEENKKLTDYKISKTVSKC